MAVIGAFQARFCSPLVRITVIGGSLKPPPTSYLLFVGTIPSQILSTITTPHKHGQYAVACLNGTEPEPEPEPETEEDEVEVEIEMVKSGNNARKIEARVAIEAPLQAVWDLLTDYEGLADFIPGLSQSQLLQQAPNYARLFQVGEQKLGLGLKFNAKGIIDCFERDLQETPSGARSRDIDFRMVQGDFEVFEGKWSIAEDEETSMSCVLCYSLQVKPKMWLPVKLVESRLCKEIRVNLASIRRQAIFLTNNVLS